MNEDLLAGAPDEIIARLTEKAISIPSWDTLKKDYYPDLHKIAKDQQTRRDKILDRVL